MLKKFSLSTEKRTQMLDITEQVSSFVTESGIREGICTVFIPHTTAGVTINENADPDVVSDLLYEMDKIVPQEDHYRHFEGNSAAHLKSSLFGFSQQMIVTNGKLLLGRWQGIYFCEFDGPRSRNFYVKITD